jgi:hypothetical protein
MALNSRVRHLVTMKDPWDGGIPGADTIQRYSHIDMVDGMDTIDGELKCGADLPQDILPRHPMVCHRIS